jgi:CDP-4-dehydro-6-deoxyglucose reductase, E1
MKYPLMSDNISREDLDLVIEHLKKDNPKLTNGPECRAFEEAWSKWLGVKYSVFVNSGASANLLSMTMLKIKHPEGGEVIVPPFTWISDIASIIQCGFTPVFVDIDLDTLGMNTDGIINAITDKTCAVFLTYAQGFNCLSEKLLIELGNRNIPLIEDVCESHGATHNNKLLGSFGWMSNFSFYFAHHMSTIEGGMVCTNSEEVYHTVRMLRSHGMVRECGSDKMIQNYQKVYPELNPEFIFAYPAYNMRNTEIGGILGQNQLKYLDNNVTIRNENLFEFLSRLDQKKYKVDFRLVGCSNYAFNIVLQTEYANKEFAQRLMNKMRDNEIEFRRGSAGGGNQLRQPYLKGIVADDHYKNYPNTDHMHFYSFYIGNYPTLPKSSIKEITDGLNKV